MSVVDPHFEYSAVALSRSFRGSPHVDTYDVSFQWALSLGDFEGGALCVEAAADEVAVVDTKHKAAKVDGRYPHWVSPWTGERYSVIAYRTRGQPTPRGPAVYPPQPLTDQPTPRERRETPAESCAGSWCSTSWTGSSDPPILCAVTEP